MPQDHQGAALPAGSPEYRIDRYRVPGTWENYISNDEYCLIVTSTGRGLSFYRYLPFFQVSAGGRYVYLRDPARNLLWGINHEPPQPLQRALHEDLHPLVLTQDAQRAVADPPFPLPPSSAGFTEYECVHGAGYTRMSSVFEGVRASLALVVGENEYDVRAVGVAAGHMGPFLSVVELCCSWIVRYGALAC